MLEEKVLDLSDAESRILAEEAVKFLIEKKALDVKLYDVAESSGITDFYVNCTARSSTHVAALADDLTEKFEERGKLALRTEGKRGNSWILVDFGSLIVNVFDSEARNYYNFDRLLPQESAVDIEALIAEVDAKFNVNIKINNKEI